jgi:peroxiredoxin
MPVAVGPPAPDFTLPDQHGRDVTSSSKPALERLN